MLAALLTTNDISQRKKPQSSISNFTKDIVGKIEFSTQAAFLKQIHSVY